MALVLADRVKETTTTTGTGTLTLAGAATGFQSFSVIGNGNTTYYAISSSGGSEFEVGIGTYTSSGTTLARTTILASSNSGSAVNLSAGTKDVFVTLPSAYAIATATTVSDTANSSTGYFQLPKGTTAQRPGTLSAGMTRWNTSKTIVEVYDGTLWQAVTVSPADVYSVEMYAWGGGGGGIGTGGGGGAAYGVYAMPIGTAHAVVVGGGGTSQGPNTNPGSTVPGGGGLAPTIGFAGQGGGYSGIFTTSALQANALLIAGGGGGSGYSAAGGAGGGTTGADGAGSNVGAGGTQSAGGLGGNAQGGATDGSALQGGTSGSTGDQGGGGGGGGGDWGGGSGWNGDSPAGNSGGGGGSGYFKSGTVTSAVLTAGSGSTPGDSSNALRGTYGNGGSSGSGNQGVFIIRYTGSQRGTGGTVTSSGGYTYHTFTTAGTYTG